MGFREDLEALQARADSLQRELDSAHREIGRLQVEHRESTEEAVRLRERLASLEASPGSQRSPLRRFFMVVFAIGTLLGGIVLMAYQGQGADLAHKRHELERTRAELDRAKALIAEQQSSLERALAQSGERPSEPQPERERPAERAAQGHPERPTTTQIREAILDVRGEIERCARGRSGRADVEIAFSSSGRVASATVKSPPFAGTPEGSCMARAIRSVEVPPFSEPTVTVRFPFVLP